MRSALIALLLFAGLLPVHASEVGIRFSEMEIGTRIVTAPVKDDNAASLSNFEKTVAEEYVGQQDGFHLTRLSHLNRDGSWKPVVTIYYDEQGRRVKSERNGRWSTYTPYSCTFVLGSCEHTYVYYNPITKKDVTNVDRYKNRLEGDTFYRGYVRSDGSLLEIPYKLGRYNFRISSEYTNALGHKRGHRLVEFHEPSASAKATPAKPREQSNGTSVKEMAKSEDPNVAECMAQYEKLKAEAPGDISKCEPVIKPAKLLQCKVPTSYTGGRPASHIILALDASGSMAGKVGGKRKMAVAKRQAAGFLGALPREVPVGLVVYGHKGNNKESGKAESCNAIEWAHKVSKRRGRIKRNIASLKPVGWTPLADMFDFLRSELQSLSKTSRRPKGDDVSTPVVYVISDGKETCGGDPVAAAQALQASGMNVRVNVIGFDVDDETRSQLEAVSEAGGGKFYPAKDARALRSQLEAIKDHEGQLARYNYCTLLNLGRAVVPYHNATVELAGCLGRENDRKRWNLIRKGMQKFEKQRGKSCPLKVSLKMNADSRKDNNWFQARWKELRAGSDAAAAAIKAQSLFGTLSPKK